MFFPLDVLNRFYLKNQRELGGNFSRFKGNSGYKLAFQS